jgi:hypothetical protein
VVTEFPTGTKVWGQVVQPAIGTGAGPKYLSNSVPGNGSLSITVDVNTANSDGVCPGGTCSIVCYADWNPQLTIPPSNSSITLVATYAATTKSTTIKPSSKYTPIPQLDGNKNVVTVAWDTTGAINFK